MNKIDEMLKEFEGLLGNTDEASNKRITEIAEWLNANVNEEVREKVRVMFDRRMELMDKSLDTIRQQIGEEGYKLLPVTYIAEHYFGKTKAWLYQRINGTSVRGKVYTLNAEQKRIFNSALDDIAGKIRSYRLA